MPNRTGAGTGTGLKSDYQPGADGWPGSLPICSLRDFLAENPAVGARVGISPDGRLAMRFDPFLDPMEDGKRFIRAVRAVELFIAAKDDMVRLVNTGRMQLTQWED